MLKLALRTRQAEKQAAKRLAYKDHVEAVRDANSAKHTRRELNDELRMHLRQARRLRKEVWTMGPLAPRHDHAGSAVDSERRGHTANKIAAELFTADSVPHWGSISVRRLRSEYSPLTDREIEARCAWAGTPKRLCLAVGDRMVVTEGPFKGQIGPIKELRLEEATVTLEGIARTNITVSEVFNLESGQAVQQQESSIPLNAVRLVHPLTDPATGHTRDVIIRELRPVAFQLDRATRRLAFSRVVPGLNVRIPWPRPAQPPPEPEEHEIDTLRIDAEQVSFVPTLLRPPAPDAVLDELRNRYSRFRTRHTAEYIAAKEAEEAAHQEARKYGYSLVKGQRQGLPPPAMRTPLDEFHIQQKALRRARGQPQLTDDMLERIGRLMASNKALREGSTGTAEPAPSSA